MGGDWVLPREPRSVRHASALLVLDEPTTGLDPASRSQLWAALVGAGSGHLTVIGGGGVGTLLAAAAALQADGITLTSSRQVPA